MTVADAGDTAHPPRPLFLKLAGKPCLAKRWWCTWASPASSNWARRLIEHRMDAATPAAAVSRGTLPGERVVVAALAHIAAAVAGPTTTIIGRVVALRERLRQGDAGAAG